MTSQREREVVEREGPEEEEQEAGPEGDGGPRAVGEDGRGVVAEVALAHGLEHADEKHACGSAGVYMRMRGRA